MLLLLTIKIVFYKVKVNLSFNNEKSSCGCLTFSRYFIMLNDSKLKTDFIKFEAVFWKLFILILVI